MTSDYLIEVHSYPHHLEQIWPRNERRRRRRRRTRPWSRSFVEITYFLFVVMCTKNGRHAMFRVIVVLLPS